MPTGGVIGQHPLAAGHRLKRRQPACGGFKGSCLGQHAGHFAGQRRKTIGHQGQKCLTHLGIGGGELRGHLPIGFEGFKRHLPITARHQHAGDGVVVFVGDGVEFVVVAAGTAEGQAEKRLAKRVDPVVGAVCIILSDVDGRMDFLPQIPEAGSDHRFVRPRQRIEPRMRQQVASNLLAHELIVGQIGVERLEHPIAVAPGIGDRQIEFVAPRFGIAHHIEPMAGEAFAIVGRGEELVDIFFKRQRIGIGDNPGQILLSCWQPGEQFARAAHKHLPRGFRRR